MIHWYYRYWKNGTLKGVKHIYHLTKHSGPFIYKASYLLLIHIILVLFSQHNLLISVFIIFRYVIQLDGLCSFCQKQLIRLHSTNVKIHLILQSRIWESYYVFAMNIEYVNLKPLNTFKTQKGCTLSTAKLTTSSNLYKKMCYVTTPSFIYLTKLNDKSHEI